MGGGVLCDDVGVKVLSVRVPVGFWLRCKRAAELEGVGLSEWVRLVLWRAVEGVGE